jgi:hypothetical protein
MSGRRSLTRPTLGGAYVIRRVGADGRVRVAGRRWRPRGEGATPGRYLAFWYDPASELLKLHVPGIELEPQIARLWEPDDALSR